MLLACRRFAQSSLIERNSRKNPDGESAWGGLDEVMASTRGNGGNANLAAVMPDAVPGRSQEVVDDDDRPRRRPHGDPQRAAHAARRRAGLRGGRRGRRRRCGAALCPRPQADRAPARPQHARSLQPRGRARHPRGLAADRDRRADDAKRARLRPPGAAGGGARLRAEGGRRRRAGAGGAQRRRRRHLPAAGAGRAPRGRGRRAVRPTS